MGYLFEPEILKFAALTLGGAVCASMLLAGGAFLLMLMRRQSLWQSMLFGSNRVFLPLMLPAVMAALFISSTYANVKFLGESEITTGTVVALSSSRDSDGDLTYSAVIEFTPPGGTLIRFDDDSRTCTPPCNKVGDVVKVRYRVSDPTVAMMNSPIIIWILPVVMLGLAIGFGLGALFGIWSAIRSQNKQSPAS
jgi:hypothetical protein